MTPVSPRCPACGYWVPAEASICPSCGYVMDPYRNPRPFTELDALDPISRTEVTVWELEHWPYWPTLGVLGGLVESSESDLGIDPGGWS